MHLCSQSGNNKLKKGYYDSYDSYGKLVVAVMTAINHLIYLNFNNN